MALRLLCLLLSLPVFAFSQWNPDAGVIPSYTWKGVVATSSGNNGENVIDSDDQSKWQSAQPLPNGFIESPQNIFKNFCELGFCKSSSLKDTKSATDANLSSNTVVTGNNGAWFMLMPVMKGELAAVYVKAAVSEPLNIYAYIGKSDSLLVGTFTKEINYKWTRFDKELKNVTAIVLRSAMEFTLHEVAALSKPPVESVTVDFGAVKRVGWVETRHWAGGKATATKLLASTDNKNWTGIADLNPEALLKVTTRLAKPVDARYLKVEHTLKVEDYAKVYIWDISAWDEDGPYGKMPPAKKNNSTVAEILGINGIWGWGYDTCSDKRKENEGQKRFNKIASHGRNFHEMHWDVKDPDDTPDYSQMATKGTVPIAWLDWDREYKAWKDAGLEVEVTIKYSNKRLPQAVWNDPYKAAYNYAYTFARHFGPTHGNGYVDVLEAGNEPWDYPDTFFTQIQKGMVEGAKAGDPDLTVLPCALQCGFPSEETKKGGNYAGARLTSDMAKHIDAFNAHHYCYATDSNAKRRGVHPEHPEASVRGILNDIRFRDANMPGKKIFITEWGWDSNGAGEACTHSECVSELEQAIYGIRGAMFFMRLGVDRLTWYFFANGNGGLYSRSGLMSSVKTGFQEKASFRAFQAMLGKLGDKHFLNVIQENEQAWVYTFGDAAGNPTHLIAWRPVAGSDTKTETVAFNFDHAPESVWELSGATATGELKPDIAKYDAADKKLEVQVSAIPLVIQLKK